MRGNPAARSEPRPRIFVRQKMDIRKTEMDRPGNSVGQKRRGRPAKEWGADPVISFRLDYDLEWQLEHWRSVQPRAPSRSRAIRVLLRRALAAAEKEREETCAQAHVPSGD